MKYISTRGGIKPISFSDSVMMGLAEDGGLIIPESIPNISPAELDGMVDFSYQDLAINILSRFMDDIPQADLEAMIRKTYTKEIFQTEDITPLLRIPRHHDVSDEFYILDLAMGPTLAFKDLALQFLGNVFEYVLEKRDSVMNILAATSGDTGSAAIHGVKGKKRINIFVTTPLDKMSRVQAAQMYSVLDPNVFNVAIKGVFDDCQDMVKEIFNDIEFKNKHNLGAVNSINWARVAAQVVYYFKGYFAAIKQDNLDIGYEIDFAVPTGNFGNILAGYYAKQMGLPIRNLTLATNENDVLNNFFRKGVYAPRKSEDVVATSSPSMDISKASNFERFLYYLVGEAPQDVKALMFLADHGGFSFAGLPYFDRVKESGFVSGKSDESCRLEMIRSVYESSGVIIDGHTADGVKVGLDHISRRHPLICLSTAKAAKFEDLTQKAIGIKQELPEKYKNLLSMPTRYDIMEKGAVQKLEDYIAARALKSAA